MNSSPAGATSRTCRYLSRADVERIALPMSTIVAVVERALIEKASGRAHMPPKHWMEHGTRWFGGMSSVVPALGHAVMKWQSGSQGNAAKGLPYLTGMLFLNDLEDGVVVAVMDSTWITQQRTAAASAVTARHLAAPGARRFAILGCGVQAYSHLDALGLVLPDLREVIAYDIRPAAAEAFVRHAAARGLDSRSAASARAAVEAGDVVVTAGPIVPDAARPIEPGWLGAGALGITIDYDCYWSGSALAAADLLVTDDFDQLVHLKGQGYFIDAPTPDVDVGSVAAGLRPGRRSPRDSIVSLNMGVAVEDVATAKEIYELARSRGVGVDLTL
jgi:ornithine cyclodeaminase/alanine dehydrogenase-like protein (mu-crystallin family)